jgi:thioester reductase-like protein
MKSMFHSDLEDESALPIDIQPYPGSFDFSSLPNTIFLTGATGFVAAFILVELLKKTNARIFALVRAESVEHGMNRLRENLHHYSLWQDEYEERIVPVVGNLKLPLLGLTPDEFQILAETVDVIYHVGSKLSYIAPYEFLKAANVGGTQETLRLATLAKAKPYHFVSSLGILLGYQTPEGGVPEGGGEDAPLDAAKCPDVGYFRSKYVAERLVRLAHKRGIPVSIHRIGLIVGDSQNGCSNEDDFVARILLGCIQAGYGPNITNSMDMTPVDYVAKAIVHLSSCQESLGNVFHILNPLPVTWGTIIDHVIEAGYPMTKLPFQDWVEAIEDHQGETPNPLHPLLPFFHIQFAGRMLGVSNTAYHALGTEKTLKALNGSDIHCAQVDAQLIRIYLEQFVRLGRLRTVSATIPV